MILKFKGGVWHGLSFESNTAPEFIDLHGLMHTATESPEIAETVLLSDAKRTRYHMLDNDDENSDTVEYGPTERIR
jgi:hypothetical protein